MLILELCSKDSTTNDNKNTKERNFLKKGKEVLYKIVRIAKLLET